MFCAMYSYRNMGIIGRNVVIVTQIDTIDN